MGNFIGIGRQTKKNIYEHKSMPFKVTIVWRISQSRENDPKAKSRWKGNKKILEGFCQPTWARTKAPSQASCEQPTYLEDVTISERPFGLVVAPLTFFVC